LSGTKVVLGVSGSIASFKAAQLASDLVNAGYEVRAVLTAGATRFVTPLTFSAITGLDATSDLWNAEVGRSPIGHLDLARWADLMLVAPAGANTIARLPGYAAMGHVRYSTTGETILRNVQPLFAELDGGGFAIGHNGNLTNGLTLIRQLVREGAIMQSTTDTEVILHLVAKAKRNRFIDRFIEGLRALGLDRFQIDLGHPDFFRGLAEESGVSPDAQGELRTALSRKDTSTLERLVGELKIPDAVGEALLALPGLLGHEDVLERAATFARNPRSERALANLAEVYRLLAIYGLADAVLLDLGEVRGFDYYSGTHFETYVAGFGASLAAGAMQLAGIPGLVVDLRLRPGGVSAGDAVAVAVREAGLSERALIVSGADELGSDGRGAFDRLRDPAVPVVLIGNRPWKSTWPARMKPRSTRDKSPWCQSSSGCVW